MSNSEGTVYCCARPRGKVEFSNCKGPESLLFFDPRWQGTDGDSIVRGLTAHDLPDRDFDYVVIRTTDSDEADRVAADRELHYLYHSGTTVYTLFAGNGKNGNRMGLRRVRSSPAKKPPPLNVLRAIEIEGLLKAREAILSDSKAHFQLGRGAHVETYVRVRDILQYSSDVERLADWFLPGLRDRACLMGNRPALLPLLQAIRHLALTRCGWQIDIETLEHSPRNRRSAQFTARDITDRQPSEILVILAADAFARHEHEIMNVMPAPRRATCLVDVTPGEQTTSAEPWLHFPVDRHEPKGASGNCPVCPDKPTLYHVDPATEERVSMPKRHKEILRIDGLKRTEETWRAIREQDALLLHSGRAYDQSWGDDFSEPRHSAIDVDVVALLRDETFQGVCRSKLRKIDKKPDLIVMPPNDSRDALIALLEVTFGEGVGDAIEFTDRGNLGSLGPRQLREKQTVLIVDDALETGDTMHRLAALLKEELGVNSDSHDIFGFVPIALPEAHRQLQRVKNAFHTPRRGVKDRFLYGQHLYVPRAVCPWCVEMAWLKAVRKNFPERKAAIERRLKQLATAKRPGDLFNFTGMDAEIVDSVLGDVGAGLGYAAFASAMMEIRTLNDEAGKDFYLSIDHLLGDWHGGALYSGVLRTLVEGEGAVGDQIDDLRETWKKRRKLTDGELGELAWAAVRDVIPQALGQWVREEIIGRRPKDDLLLLFAEATPEL